MIVAAGNNTSFVQFKGEKNPGDGVSIHEGLTCEATGVTPIVGPMHFWEDDTWHYLSAEGYQQKKDSLPNLVFTAKYPISDLENRPWPDISSIELKPDTIDPIYISKCKANETALTSLEVSESKILNRAEFDFDPHIFIRCTRELAEGKELPTFNLTDFYPLSSTKGISIEITPDISMMENDLVIAKNKENYDEI